MAVPGPRAEFDRGVALRHSFWFSASVESFSAVLKDDPRCVMAHWGIAMSWWGNPFGGFRAAPALAAGNAAPPSAGYYAVAAIPARYALERAAWSEAAALVPPRRSSRPARAGRPRHARPLTGRRVWVTWAFHCSPWAVGAPCRTDRPALRRARALLCSGS
jgi:hypothetical protein